jgi:hypothetical protein
MWKRWLFSLSLAATPLFGQLESHTVTISATRTAYLQPDEVVFGLSVSASGTTNLNQIVAALSGVGITSTNLTGVGTSTSPPSVQWNFTLATPISNLAATIGSLAQIQQSIEQNNSGLTLSFNVEGTEVSQQLQQSQTCSNSVLIADATTQGQKLASAAGLTLGPIARLANAPLAETYGVPSLVHLGNIVSNFVLAGSFSSPITCSLVVEFQLLP